MAVGFLGENFNPGAAVMRKTFSRCILTFIFLSLIVWVPIDVAHATQGGVLFDDPYPTPEIVTQVNGNTEKSIGLILGAGLIVVVIFGGVLYRRIKS